MGAETRVAERAAQHQTYGTRAPSKAKDSYKRQCETLQESTWDTRATQEQNYCNASKPESATSTNENTKNSVVRSCTIKY